MLMTSEFNRGLRMSMLSNLIGMENPNRHDMSKVRFALFKNGLEVASSQEFIPCYRPEEIGIRVSEYTFPSPPDFDEAALLDRNGKKALHTDKIPRKRKVGSPFTIPDVNLSF